MTKLQKYNRIAFAVISVPVFLLACLAVFFMICELRPRSYPEYDQNKGVISKAEASKNAEKQEYSQYISYNSMFVLNPEQQEFVVPVIARTMEKPEHWTERFRFSEQTVNEVVFDEAESATLSTSISSDGSSQNKPVKPIRPKKMPDTTTLKRLFTEQFVNLVYENGANKIHRSVIDERFTGWDLNYIRNGKKRYLAFLGTKVDSNNDGYLNNDDQGDFYLYDIDSKTTQIVKIPDMEIEDYFLMKNNPILIFEVKNKNRPKSHRNESFIYRYNINTGKLEDIIPEEEKQQHLKLIIQ
ncbi:hypothetical protein [Fibrobacter sp.]|uniref:hypothetical protein n=1 Tax=Fibrobacter sp. TaxID=35828 RepID=UPI0025B9F100|nr:hypothetical protein [Fibrobacter sp.]MBR3072768.1 hypothetical protein [Fibrobacter sp.]